MSAGPSTLARRDADDLDDAHRQEALDGKMVERMEHVTDEQYVSGSADPTQPDFHP